MRKPCAGCVLDFDPPKGDPGRTLCLDCMKSKGLPTLQGPRAPVVADTMEAAPVALAVCSECGQPCVPAKDETRCAACANAGGSLAWVEDTAKAREGEPEQMPIWRRLSKKDCLEYAAELAADMETGYYVREGEDRPRSPHRFNMREIMRRMGYSTSVVEQNHRPSWWPEGGTQAFRGYVEWKVRERAMLGRVTWDRFEPYVEAVTFAGFSEIARRIKLEPEKIPFRDLSQFVMRGTDHIREKADPFSSAMSKEGADAYAAIGAAIESVGDDTARKQIGALLDEILSRARDKTRQTITVLPARAG